MRTKRTNTSIFFKRGTNSNLSKKISQIKHFNKNPCQNASYNSSATSLVTSPNLRSTALKKSSNGKTTFTVWLTMQKRKGKDSNISTSNKIISSKYSPIPLSSNPQFSISSLTLLQKMILFSYGPLWSSKISPIKISILNC